MAWECGCGIVNKDSTTMCRACGTPKGMVWTPEGFKTPEEAETAIGEGRRKFAWQEEKTDLEMISRDTKLSNYSLYVIATYATAAVIYIVMNISTKSWSPSPSLPMVRPCEEKRAEESGPPKIFAAPRLGVTVRAEGGILVVEKVHSGGLAEDVGLEPGYRLIQYRGTCVFDRVSLAQAICAPNEGEALVSITFITTDQTKISWAFPFGDYGCPNPTENVAS